MRSVTDPLTGATADAVHAADAGERQGWPPEWPGVPPRSPGTPPRGPGDEGLSGWLQQRLLEQRIVMMRGHLDRETATRLSAQILTLDATGTKPVKLHVDAPDGGIDAAFVLVDALDLLVAPVHLTVLGELGGPALGLLAAADRRRAQPHARFRLAEPRSEMRGTAEEVTTQASQQLQLLDTLIERLAALTGKPRHQVEGDLGTGRYLTAREAVEYGLIEDIAGSA